MYKSLLFFSKRKIMKQNNELNWLKRRLRYNFSRWKFIRRYIGGYWECWHFQVVHGDVWMYVKKENAYDNKWRPGGGAMATPYSEYYPIGYFGYKMDFTDEVKQNTKREVKLKKILNETTK